jgi:hypothetical protein
VRAAPAEAIALQGRVLTPAGPVEDGYVVVGAGHQIQAVQAQQPQGVRVHPTGGVILPGLIDLHGHPEFNVFAAWEPPQLFANRYLWRGSPIYQALVRDTQDRLLAAGLGDAELRCAEIRALVGGVTAIQGASGRNRSTEEALVRNVDLRIFGQHRARAMIDLPSPGSRDAESSATSWPRSAMARSTPSTCTWPRAKPTTSGPRTSSAGWSTPTRG